MSTVEKWTLLIAIATFLLSVYNAWSNFNNKRKLLYTEKLLEKEYDTYSRLITVYINAITQKIFPSESEMVEIKKDLILYSSDDVIRQFNIININSKENMDRGDVLKLSSILIDLLMLVRNKLGVNAKNTYDLSLLFFRTEEADEIKEYMENNRTQLK